MTPPAIPSSPRFAMAADGGGGPPLIGGGGPPLIALSPGVISVALAVVFFLGGCVGFALGKRQGRGGARDVLAKGTGQRQTDEKLTTEPDQGNGDGRQMSIGERCDIAEEGEGEEDGPTMVLRGSLDLLASKWGIVNRRGAASMKGRPGEKDARKGADSDSGGSHLSSTSPSSPSLSSSSSSRVVEYLSPEEMTKLLFSNAHPQTLRLSEENETAPIAPEAFVRLLSLIQRYSVDTSHPYFFNQLFGSLDPVALAAEIVALSVNTSVYTYETAPVFTLLEREVMGSIGRLVFHDGEGRDVDGNEEFRGEGLMIPGGSLANLTAMHAARHRWKAANGLVRGEATPEGDRAEERQQGFSGEVVEEEKKLEDAPTQGPSSSAPRDDESQTLYDNDRSTPDLVAFVSSEAHYSFSKSARVLGLREDDLVVIPTHEDGRMDVAALAKRIEELESELQIATEHPSTRRRRVPFFVACTAGSTVRGSFDDVAEIVRVCRDYESRVALSNNTGHNRKYQRSIWVHVDGAWGGSAVFSSCPSLRRAARCDDVRLSDSFTFNPHKMLGAPQQTTALVVRHRAALRDANAAGAKYLFDPRKHGAAYDLGDLSYTCGRRTDAVKLWALWRFHGRAGLGRRVDRKADALAAFADEVRRRGREGGRFALACRPWPFNVNFFYFPPRIRRALAGRGVMIGGEGDDVRIPEDVARDLADVSVRLKLRLHEAGEMIIPYQPLSNQKADCFRLVLAGRKDFGIDDIRHVLDTMEKYGEDL